MSAAAVALQGVQHSMRREGERGKAVHGRTRAIKREQGWTEPGTEGAADGFEAKTPSQTAAHGPTACVRWQWTSWRGAAGATRCRFLEWPHAV